MLISSASMPSPILATRAAPKPQHSQNSSAQSIEKAEPSAPEQDQKQSGAKATPEQLNLTEQEQRQVDLLKTRDREVKAHELAHLSAAAGLALGGATFAFKTGPDGRRYAVGGEVQIDTSAVPNDPIATLRKADIIRRAALAPAQPSQQDHSVAAQASAMAAQARAELLQRGNQNPPAGEKSTENSGEAINLTA